MTVPTAGLKDQLTDVLLVPVTEAAKVAEAPPPNEAVDGPTVTATGIKDTVALAILLGSAALVAITVTVCWLAIIVGAR